jgi:hypothetical protein
VESQPPDVTTHEAAIAMKEAANASKAAADVFKAAAETLKVSAAEGALLVFIIMIMGMVGGAVSVFQRMSNTPIRGATMTSVIELVHGRYGVMVSPLYGAVFAIVLSLLFAGNLVKGQLFPEFTSPSGSSSYGWTFTEFFSKCWPNAASDVAKLIVWSFLAGFAERLVPDALDRIVAQSQSTPATKPPIKS